MYQLGVKVKHRVGTRVESPIRVDDSQEMTQKIARRLTWTQYPTTTSNYADYVADDTLITKLSKCTLLYLTYLRRWWEKRYTCESELLLHHFKFCFVWYFYCKIKTFLWNIYLLCVNRTIKLWEYIIRLVQLMDKN